MVYERMGDGEPKMDDERQVIAGWRRDRRLMTIKGSVQWWVVLLVVGANTGNCAARAVSVRHHLTDAVGDELPCDTGDRRGITGERWSCDEGSPMHC